MPAGTAVHVTDLQLQPGRAITGWTLHQSDLGVEPVEGWHWRNAVVSGVKDLVVVADVASASPTMWDVRGKAERARVGQYHYGPVAGSARVDGFTHEATQGAGIPPHLTARSDVPIGAAVTAGRVLACCWFRGVTVAPDRDVDGPPPAHVDGPLLEAHPAWWQVCAHHETWVEVRAAHPDWS